MVVFFNYYFYLSVLVLACTGAVNISIEAQQAVKWLKRTVTSWGVSIYTGIEQRKEQEDKTKEQEREEDQEGKKHTYDTITIQRKNISILGRARKRRHGEELQLLVPSQLTLGSLGLSWSRALTEIFFLLECEGSQGGAGSKVFWVGILRKTKPYLKWETQS